MLQKEVNDLIVVSDTSLQGDRFEYTEDLSHPANQETLLVDFDPDAGAGGEDDVVSALHRHLDAGPGPPVKTRPHREHDALLGRRLVRPWWDNKPGAADPVLIQLLDHDLVE
jgi:hypothetical protein